MIPEFEDSRLLLLLAFDGKKFDFEDEGGKRSDLPSGPLPTVGELGRNGELPLRTNRHELQSFGPTGDHAADLKFRWLLALHRAIQHLSVNQAALLFHFHTVDTASLFPRPVRLHFLLQPGTLYRPPLPLPFPLHMFLPLPPLPLPAGLPLCLVVRHQLAGLRHHCLVETDDHDLFRLQARCPELYLEQWKNFGAAFDFYEDLLAVGNRGEHLFECGDSFGLVFRVLPAPDVEFSQLVERRIGNG